MRFTIGQKLFTIGLVLNSKSTGKIAIHGHFVNPIPSLYSISKIQFNELTITEHHKVAGEWSDKKEYDGFKAVDKNGLTYSNQYPIASYGQLSDNKNHEFELDLIEESYEKNSHLSLDQFFESIFAQNLSPYNYELIRFMNDLDGGFVDDNNMTDYQRDYPEVYSQLQQISNQVQQQFKKDTGLNLVFNIEKLFKRNYKSWIIES